MKKLLKTRILPLLAALVLLISALVIPVSAENEECLNRTVVLDTFLDPYCTGSASIPTFYRIYFYFPDQNYIYALDYPDGSINFEFELVNGPITGIYYDDVSGDLTLNCSTGQNIIVYYFNSCASTCTVCFRDYCNMDGPSCPYDHSSSGGGSGSGDLIECSTCGYSYDGSLFSACPYAACDLNASDQVNWRHCSACEHQYDADVFSACPYLNCSTNLYAGQVLCSVCDHYYSPEFDACPYAVCSSNAPNDVLCLSCNHYYDYDVFQSCPYAGCSSKYETCSECLRQYPNDYDSCPYASCAADYDDHFTSVCQTCNRKYLDSFAMCPYVDCASNVTEVVEWSTCSTCHRRYESKYGACPFNDCDENMPELVNWKTCSTCHNRYDGDVFSACPYKDCNLNKVKWITCMTCWHRYESNVFSGCPYVSCRTNSSIVFKGYCVTCRNYYNNVEFTSCPYVSCDLNKAHGSEECSRCHYYYNTDYFSSCPYAVCELNKAVIQLRGPSAAMANASIRFVFTMGLLGEHVFVYDAKCSELIDSAGIVHFDRVKDDLLAAAVKAGYTTDEIGTADIDVTVTWESSDYWDPANSKFFIETDTHVQTVKVYSGKKTYSASLSGGTGARSVMFDSSFSSEVTSVCVSLTEAEQLWDTEVFFYSADYNSGFNSGYSEAVDDLEASYGSQIDESYDLGFLAGNREGFNEGYDSGYYDGKVWGSQITEAGNFRDLMTAVVDAPVKFISNFFSFEILGQDMRQFFGALLTFSIVLYLVKKVLK